MDPYSTMSPFMPAGAEEMPTPEEMARREAQLRAMQDLATMGGSSHFRGGGSVPEFGSGIAQGAVGGAGLGLDGMLGMVGMGLPDQTMMDMEAMAAKNPYTAFAGGVAGGGGAMGVGAKLFAMLRQLPKMAQIGTMGAGATAAGSTPLRTQTASDEPIEIEAVRRDPAALRRAQQMLKNRGLYAGAADGALGGATEDAIKQWNAKVGSAKANDPVALQREKVAAQQRREDQEREDKKAKEDADARRLWEYRSRREKKEAEIAKERSGRSTGENMLHDYGMYGAGAALGLGFRGAQRFAQGREGVKGAGAVAGMAETAREGAHKFGTSKVETSKLEGLGKMQGAAEALYASRGVRSPFAAKDPGDSSQLYKTKSPIREDAPAYAAIGAGGSLSYGMEEKYRAMADEAILQYNLTGDDRHIERAKEFEQQSQIYAKIRQAETGLGLTFAASSKFPRPSPFPRDKNNPSQPGKDVSDVLAGEGTVKRYTAERDRKAAENRYKYEVATYRTDAKSAAAAGLPPPPRPQRPALPGQPQAASGNQSAGLAADAAKTVGAGVAGGAATVGVGEGIKAYSGKPDDKKLSHLREAKMVRREGFEAIKDSPVMQEAVRAALEDPRSSFGSGERAGALRPSVVTRIVKDIQERTGHHVSPYMVRKMLQERGVSIN